MAETAWRSLTAASSCCTVSISRSFSRLCAAIQVVGGGGELEDVNWTDAQNLQLDLARGVLQAVLAIAHAVLCRLRIAHK